MLGSKKLSEAYKNGHRLFIDNSSKIIFFSDCHRGDRSRADDFTHNENIYLFALGQYFNENYTYIELGDGDELWENKRFDKLYEGHRKVYDLIGSFAQKQRFYMVQGNHDFHWMYKENRKQLEEKLSTKISYSDSIILLYNDKELFCVHGHQVDGVTARTWKLNRLFVRYVWKKLQKIGINDVTSPVQNSYRRNKVEKKLQTWSQKNSTHILAGHTHRPAFPIDASDLYLNTGSCVHPDCISGVEILNGTIFPVTWAVTADKEGVLRVTKRSDSRCINLSDFG